jgi:hypothetical protein
VTQNWLVIDLPIQTIYRWFPCSSPWKRLEKNCTQLKTQHIYKGFNKKVDLLSKTALTLEEEGLYFAAIKNGYAEFLDRLDIS